MWTSRIPGFLQIGRKDTAFLKFDQSVGLTLSTIRRREGLIFESREMRATITTYLLLGLLTLGINVASGQDSMSFYQNAPSPQKSRVKAVVITESVGYVGTMVALNQLWYAGYPRSAFHGFNDNAEWLQMDKMGHAATGYYVGYAGMGALQWAGVDRRKALWYGGSLGWIFLTSVEVFDGFSQEWGASYGDLAANTVGYGLLIGQEYAWQEQRIKMKFSAHLSDYAELRPGTLGSTFSERLLKDYNGQSYWLSANVSDFLPEDSAFPKWLNVAFGYSGDGMITGHPDHHLDEDLSLPSIDRYRQYFLSLDVDWTKVRRKPGFLRTALQSIGFIKFPAPALEFHGRDGLRFHLLYF